MSMTFEKQEHYAVLTHFDNSGQQEWIRIPEEYEGLPVAGIGASAFQGDPYLKCVVLPMSIYAIGQGAFENCKLLQCVGVGDPSTTGKIPTHSVLPPGLSSIDDNAFANTNLINVTFTGDVIIGSYCFSGCAKLKDVLFHCCSGTFGQGAFSHSSIEILHMPNGKPEISLPEELFSQCKQLRYVGLNAPASIGHHCFAGCENLASLCLSPDHPIPIGRGTFEGCKQVDVRGLHRTALEVLLAMGTDAVDEAITLFKEKYDDLGLVDFIILVHEANKLLDDLSKVAADQLDTVLVSYVGVGYTSHNNRNSGYHCTLYSRKSILHHFQSIGELSKAQPDTILHNDDAMLRLFNELPSCLPWNWDDKEAIFCSLAVGTPFEQMPRKVAVELLFSYLDYHLIEEYSDDTEMGRC